MRMALLLDLHPAKSLLMICGNEWLKPSGSGEPLTNLKSATACDLPPPYDDLLLCHLLRLS